MTLLRLLPGLLLPLVPGPLAGVLFVSLLRRRASRAAFVAFWAGVALANLAVLAWIAIAGRDLSNFGGSTACLFTPAAALLTVLFMQIAWRRSGFTAGTTSVPRRAFLLALLLLPALQLLLPALAALLGPFLGQSGLFPGSGW